MSSKPSPPLTPAQRLRILRKLAALPIAHWRYKFEPKHVRHIGPMAEDFAAAFKVGASKHRIALIDAIGVAYASIQALHALIEQRRREIADLRRRVGRLKKARTRRARRHSRRAV